MTIIALMRDSLAHDLVRDHTVYACVMGSRAFGLATDDSDIDRRGVFVAPTSLYWHFDKPPTHVTGPLDEQFSWELERFCTLALRANPNLLEVLHSPLVEHADDTGRELLDLRGAFLSRRADATFRGYAAQQLGKLEADIRNHGEPRWKHAMHLLRLLMSCRDLLRTGRLTIDVGEQRDRLLSVRRGELTWEEVRGWMRTLHEEADDAVTRSPLPADPDTARVEDYLLRVRRSSAAAALGGEAGVVAGAAAVGGVPQPAERA
jgi:predicted nucleotidyltransferase